MFSFVARGIQKESVKREVWRLRPGRDEIGGGHDLDFHACSQYCKVTVHRVGYVLGYINRLSRDFRYIALSLFCPSKPFAHLSPAACRCEHLFIVLLDRGY
jgi:hypothetical protein